MDTVTAIRLGGIAASAAITVFGMVSQRRYERQIQQDREEFIAGRQYLRDVNAWADNVDDQLAAHRNARKNGQTPNVIVIDTVRDN